MTLDELLKTHAANPGTVLAWESDQPGDVMLSVFRVEGGTSQLGHMVVHRGDRETIATALAARGIETGAYASGTGIVWLRKGHTFTVWGARGRVFHTDGVSLDTARHTSPFQTSMQVIASIDDDLVGRGVRLEGGDTPIQVAQHRQLRASMDPSYGPLDALADAGWTVYLGQELADTLGVPFVDRTG